MNTDMELWQKRVGAYVNEAIRYLRVIFSSGFVLALYFIIVIGGYYYRQWISSLNEQFPSALGIAIVMTVLLSTGAVRTFVKEADLVFLLPFEGRLQRYFRASYLYSLTNQVFVLIVVMFGLMPLYFAQINQSAAYLFISIGLLVVAKAWNLYANFQEQRLQEKTERNLHIVLRIAVNAVFCFLLFKEAWLFVLCIVAVMLMTTIFYYQHFTRRHSLKWERLIEIERRQVLFFYRIANAFTDVPALKGTIKRRAWADSLFSFIKYGKKNVFTYLFARSFFRYGDLLGIYLRLIIIGSLFIYLIPDMLAQIAVMLAFIYMTGMQLSTLWYHYDTKIWVDLYPLSKEEKKRNFSSLLFVLLIVQMIIYALVLIASSNEWIYFLASLVAGSLLAYFYSFIFVNKRRKAM